jgi:hypothetical protein
MVPSESVAITGYVVEGCHAIRLANFGVIGDACVFNAI